MATSKKKPKVWRSKEQWKALLDELPKSGLTRFAFCKKHKIGTSSLHKWKKYFSNQTGSHEFVDISKPLAETPSSQPLTSNDKCISWQVELELGNSIVLRIGKN